MESVNIHDAKTHLSRLVQRASEGETIILARAGKPVAKLSAIETSITAPSRMGFLVGQMDFPDDFDQMDAEAIIEEFEGRA